MKLKDVKGVFREFKNEIFNRKMQCTGRISENECIGPYGAHKGCKRFAVSYCLTQRKSLGTYQNHVEILKRIAQISSTMHSGAKRA